MNPKVSDFLARKPDLTLVGLCWSMYWRFVIIIVAIEIAILTVSVVIGSLVSFVFHA